MLMQSKRFGEIEVDESRIITFPAGLVGFSDCTRFVLLEDEATDDESSPGFYWLQSVDREDLAFLVTDPARWLTDYEPPIRRELIDKIMLERLEDMQIFVIVSRYEGRVTVNCRGPLIVNCATWTGVQLIVADQQWSARHEILQLRETIAAA